MEEEEVKAKLVHQIFELEDEDLKHSDQKVKVIVEADHDKKSVLWPIGHSKPANIFENKKEYQKIDSSSYLQQILKFCYGDLSIWNHLSDLGNWIKEQSSVEWLNNCNVSLKNLNICQHLKDIESWIEKNVFEIFNERIILILLVISFIILVVHRKSLRVLKKRIALLEKRSNPPVCEKCSNEELNAEHEKSSSLVPVDMNYNQVFNKLKEIAYSASIAPSDSDENENCLNDDFLSLISKRIAGDDSMMDSLKLITAEDLLKFGRMYQKIVDERSSGGVNFNFCILINGKELKLEVDDARVKRGYANLWDSTK